MNTRVRDALIAEPSDAAVPSPKEPRERYARDAAVVFAGLWAAATLFHLAAGYDWDRSLPQLLLTAAAIALLVRPTSLHRLLLLAALQCFAAAIDAPYLPNHLLFMAFVNVTILGAWLLLVVKQRTLAIDKGRLFRTVAPVVRIELLILYFFAVLHKLNADFFAPEVSCGVVFFRAVTGVFSVVPPSAALDEAAIYATLLAEAAIPLLLLFRTTRNAGILFGAAFHFLITLHPGYTFYDFSSMLLALFFLFAPEDLGTRSRAYYHELRAKLKAITARLSSQSLAYRLALIGIGLLVVFGVGILFKSRDYRPLIWVVYSIPLIALFVRLLARGSLNEQPRHGTFTPAYPVLLLVLLLVFLNGMSPYLGLKIESSFAMFSNLRTEGGQTNHFFVPASLQVFDFQKDLVEVTGSSNEWLQALADTKQLLPYLEFRIRSSWHPDASVSYIRNGQEVYVARVADDPVLSQPVPFLLKQVLWFRTADKGGRQECRH